MSLCINPKCPNPTHPDNSRSVICQACGSGLLLQGRYRVMRLLSNSSGFGTVYEAYQQNIPKILKVLRRDRSDNPKVLALFRKEAEVLSQLDHPGVPLVEKDGYFIYRPKDSSTPLHCIVMEKIDGPNLQQWMQQQGNHPIGEKQAFQWTLQLTEILRLVHQHNYFHRDIKPDNIMLRANGQLVLVDFGAAREMSSTYLAQIGSLGVTTVSSAGYTPPEQEQGQAVPQSDFYAMGRTIIYLLTGRSPNDSTLYDPMLNVFNWRPCVPELSEGFAELLENLVSPRVVDRPKTANEILERLHRLSLSQWASHADLRAPLEETALPMDRTTRAENRLPRPDRTSPRRPAANKKDSASISHWTWLIAGGVTLAAVALIGLGTLSRNRSQPTPAQEKPVPNGVTPAQTTPTPTIQAELLRTFTTHQNSVNDMQLLSDQRRFVSASADSSLILWDMSSGEALRTFSGHTTFVNAIAISPDEKTLYSGSADGAIFAWNLDTGEKVAEFAGHAGPVNSLERTPDGQVLVSGASDGTIKLWDTRTGTPIDTLEGHSGAINALAITDDGQRVISGGTDRTIRIWDIQTGEQLGILAGHESYINAIAVSPDGRFLFSASADQTLKRWNLATGEVLGTLTGHASYVNTLVLSRDGQTVSSGGADETIHVWDVANGDLIAVYAGFGMPVDHIVLPGDEQVVTASKETSAIKAWLVEP